MFTQIDPGEFSGDAMSYLVAFSVVALVLGLVMLHDRRYRTAACFLAYIPLAWYMPALAAWIAVLLICGLVLVLGYHK